jgi:lantibiotic modifying enzyme
MLLAVLHVLAITDIHCENIIAAGEHPVVVDLETLLNAWVPTDGSAPWSVLNTGLLPRWQTAPDGHRFDMSGLAADAAQDAGIGRRAWIHVNTDQMHLSGPVAVGASMTHRPAVAEATPDVKRHLSEFIAGFREMYSHLQRSRDKLLRDSSTLAMFDNLKLRVLLRGTTTYTRLQLRLLHPEFMASGLDRSIELEWLARPLSGPSALKRERQYIYEHERAAMEALDVPHFTNAFASLITDGRGDPDLTFLCARRDSSVVRERLCMLTAEDCDRQIEMIEQAMQDRYSASSS